MAKPERLTAGFELANGRAADRVSEKEAEAGRSRRRSRTTSAAASPWHDPGLRLQRLHKEAFLGAAVSLLVRGRRQAGPRALPCVSRGRRAGSARADGPAGVAGSRRPPPRPRQVARTCSPLARSSRSCQNLAPAPPTGAGLLPLTGGRTASLLTWPPAGLGSLLCCPPAGLLLSLYGQKLVPSCLLVGGRLFFRRRRLAPSPLARRWA